MPPALGAGVRDDSSGFLEACRIQESSSREGRVGNELQRAPADVVEPANRMGRKLPQRQVDENISSRTLERRDLRSEAGRCTLRRPIPPFGM